MQGIKTAGPLFPGFTQKVTQRPADRLGIKGGDHPTQTVLADPLTGYISFGNQDGKAGPDIIEHPGSDRIAGFQVYRMSVTPT